jgi:hypothetical protein
MVAYILEHLPKKDLLRVCRKKQNKVLAHANGFLIKRIHDVSPERRPGIPEKT